jgi:biopolymer transport protein ExbD
MKVKKLSNLEEPTINLTPLIDVVFVVLIMFIIIAPILEKDRIELSKNGQVDKNSKIDKTSQISIQVTAQNQIFVNKVQINPSVLETRLKNLQKQYPSSIPQIYYDKKAYFEFFEPIKCALEKAGFSDMDLILEPAT